MSVTDEIVMPRHIHLWEIFYPKYKLLFSYYGTRQSVKTQFAFCKSLREQSTVSGGFIAYRSYLISYLQSAGGVIPQPFFRHLHFCDSLPSTFSMGTKRSWEGQAVVKMDTTESASPMISIFENFRDELDEHHDRRERIIKASRDITALSKKM